MSFAIDQFKQLYQRLNKYNIKSILSEVYGENIVFIDPFHEIRGLNELSHYFENLYENVGYCRFEFNDEMTGKNAASPYRTMELSHRRLNNGERIFVPGNTLIRYTDKVFYHRDYFDAGNLIYENVPLLNHAVNFIKARL